MLPSHLSLFTWSNTRVAPFRTSALSQLLFCSSVVVSLYVVQLNGVEIITPPPEPSTQALTTRVTTQVVATNATNAPKPKTPRSRKGKWSYSLAWVTVRKPLRCWPINAAFFFDRHVEKDGNKEGCSLFWAQCSLFIIVIASWRLH